MFMLRNVGKYIFGDSTKHDIIQIDQGKLYIVRPNSPKGYSECIFKDAAACIRRTSTPYHYQLVIQRAYEEGEEQLLDDIEDADDAKDEKTFLLDESLKFRSSIRDGEAVFAWKDLQGDPGDVYEFVCDVSTQDSAISTFQIVAVQCQYERKYRKSHETATEKDLEQFYFPESPVPPASPISSPAKSSTSLNKVMAPTKSTLVVPPAAQAPREGRVLAEETAELHLYDISTGSFVMQDPEVVATVTDIGNWQYWLQIEGQEKAWLGLSVQAEINPVFNFEYLSFIFNHYTDDGSAYSWLLRFNDEATIEKFQEGLMQGLWEQLNEIKWEKAKDKDREYVLEAFQEDTPMIDAPDEEEEEEEEYEDTDEGAQDEEYDEDEEYDDEHAQPQDSGENSQLAVGYKHDRSFVVRGDRIGVFKHTAANKLEHAATIQKLRTPGGKVFNPKKLMLHQEDASLVMQDENDPHRLYRMDLERGKIVDEWNVHDDIPVTTFAPDSKFAQMTSEQTFLGISHNALFRIDPRLSGQKLVPSQLKQYASKNDFSATATTDQGYIAVASNKGDIRLFDRLGINAKTHIPALGEAIIGLDVSADGKWVLATCKNYLLLVDTEQKDGKNEGKLGFEKSFAKDAKPRPRRLGLNPSHVAQMQIEGGAINFTPAKFNTGLDSTETSIITSTGPFIVTWNLKKVVRGSKDPYTIKRYGEEIKSDNFRFGSDKNVIVALPNQVNMIDKQSFKKPTRESLMTPVRNLRSRNSIVNSPY